MRKAVCWLSGETDFSFFDQSSASRFGDLIAVGGNLSPSNVLAAYRRGIFPWFIEDQAPYWFCPKKRMILEPAELHVSKSLARVLRSGRYEITADRAFESVMLSCAKPRKREKETWIDDEFLECYSELHESGFAHSIEAWRRGERDLDDRGEKRGLAEKDGDFGGDRELVGGLYGVQIGKVFCGESMFAFAPDASKTAFEYLCRAQPFGAIDMIDCQVPSEHLRTLGGKLISRIKYLAKLEKAND